MLDKIRNKLKTTFAVGLIIASCLSTPCFAWCNCYFAYYGTWGKLGWAWTPNGCWWDVSQITNAQGSCCCDSEDSSKCGDGWSADWGSCSISAASTTAKRSPDETPAQHDPSAKGQPEPPHGATMPQS